MSSETAIGVFGSIARMRRSNSPSPSSRLSVTIAPCRSSMMPSKPPLADGVADRCRRCARRRHPRPGGSAARRRRSAARSPPLRARPDRDRRRARSRCRDRRRSPPRRRAAPGRARTAPAASAPARTCWSRASSSRSTGASGSSHSLPPAGGGHPRAGNVQRSAASEARVPFSSYSHAVSAAALRPAMRPKARHSPILPVP